MKRKEKKVITRNRIIKSAYDIFIKKGFINTSTAEIAKKAGIAHGTLFNHFSNKKELLLSLVSINSQNRLKIFLSSNEKPETFENSLKFYLEQLSKHENYYSHLYREMPFYDQKIQRKIFFEEYRILKRIIDLHFKEIQQAVPNDLDPFPIINNFFIPIKHYLCYKHLYVTDNKSVIKKFRYILLENLYKTLNNYK